VTVNSAVAIYDTQGTLISYQDLDKMLGQTLACPIGDPHCLFDPSPNAGRFVICALSNSSTGSYVWLAVSRTADPTAGWYTFKGTTTGAIDFPALGYDDVNYCVSVWSDQPSSKVLFFEKAKVLLGQQPTVIPVPVGLPLHLQPVISWEHPRYQYFVEARDRVLDQRLYLWAAESKVNPTVLQSKGTTLTWPANAPLSVPSCNGQVTFVYTRSLSGSYWSASDTIVTAHAIGGAPGKASTEWADVNTNRWPASGNDPTVRRFGIIEAGTSVFMPAVARNNRGVVGMVAAIAGAGVPPGMAVAGRNPTGIWSPLVTVKTGICNSPTSPMGWGDFFAVVVDPSDSAKFWAIGQFAKGPFKQNVPGFRNPRWGTWIQSFRVR
jgi:hypothetical protein